VGIEHFHSRSRLPCARQSAPHTRSDSFFN
jgi:hypothetical protein